MAILIKLSFHPILRMSERGTTIHISKEVWKKLNNMKNVGESFDSVLRRLLEIDNEHKNG